MPKFRTAGPDDASPPVTAPICAAAPQTKAQPPREECRLPTARAKGLHREVTTMPSSGGRAIDRDAELTVVTGVPDGARSAAMSCAPSASTVRAPSARLDAVPDVARVCTAAGAEARRGRRHHAMRFDKCSLGGVPNSRIWHGGSDSGNQSAVEPARIDLPARPAATLCDQAEIPFIILDMQGDEFGGSKPRDRDGTHDWYNASATRIHTLKGKNPRRRMHAAPQGFAEHRDTICLDRDRI